MAPKGARISIVEITDGKAEASFQVCANVVAGPIRVNEVCGSARTEHAGSTGRSGRIQTDGDNVGKRKPRLLNGDLQAVLNLPDVPGLPPKKAAPPGSEFYE